MFQKGRIDWLISAHNKTKATGSLSPLKMEDVGKRKKRRPLILIRRVGEGKTGEK